MTEAAQSTVSLEDFDKLRDDMISRVEALFAEQSSHGGAAQRGSSAAEQLPCCRVPCGHRRSLKSEFALFGGARPIRDFAGQLIDTAVDVKVHVTRSLAQSQRLDAGDPLAGLRVNHVDELGVLLVQSQAQMNALEAGLGRVQARDPLHREVIVTLEQVGGYAAHLGAQAVTDEVQLIPAMLARLTFQFGFQQIEETFARWPRTFWRRYN
ncbi:unnamed protein product [Trichogramma brassicae]|uniref:Uncharacterized protein n=1 Tax=Trichogramma brassicae TaxID=86971 RepID=A0A6H5IRC5_9HYME|nr:unnamed protein product [Trichogramma brassicae]